MTVRAVIVGLLGAAFVAGFTYFNDNIMRQTLFIGNHMPHSIYGTLVLFLLLVNPLLVTLGGPARSRGVALLTALVAGEVSGLVAGLAAGVAAGPVAGIAAGLVTCASVALVAGIATAFIPGGKASATTGAVAGLVAVLAAGLAAGVLPGAIAGLAACALASVAAWLIPGVFSAPSEARSVGLGGTDAPSGDIIASISAGLVAASVGGPAAGLVTGLVTGAVPGLIVALVAGALVGLTAGIFAARAGGRSTGPSETPAAVPVDIPEDVSDLGKPGPIARAAGPVAGSVTGVIVGVVTGLSAGPLMGLFAGTIAGLVAGVVTAVLAARTAFSGAELAVALTITLSACTVPAAGLMRYLTNAVMLPQHKAKSRPGWEAEDVIRMAPDYMLAGTSPAFREDDIVDGGSVSAELARLPGDAPGVEMSGKLSPAQARIWGALSEEHREAIREAAGASGAGTVAKPVAGGPEPGGGAARPGVAPDKVPDKVREKAPGETPGTKPGEAPVDPAELRSRRVLVRAFNSLLDSRELYSRDAFSGVTLSAEAEKVLARAASPAEAGGVVGGSEPGARLPESIDRLDARDVRALNRHLVDAAWPDATYPHAKRRYDELYSFIFGKSRGKQPVGIGEVPWSAWVRPLCFWIPFFIVLAAGLIGLALVVHKQWADHEQLPYPVARFVQSLLPAKEGSGGGALRNRLFLAAAGCVVLLHALNYSDVWRPGWFARIPTSFDFSSLQTLFPKLGGGYHKWALFTPRFYFAVVGLAYLVASDVSLSVGIAAPVSVCVAAFLARHGITLGGSGGLYSGSPRQTFSIGAYLGMLLTLIYTGRRYYASVFRKAVFLRPRDEVGPGAVWGARAFLLSATGFTLYLVAIGVDWQLAVIYTFMAFMLFVVMSRILAETGLFFMEPRWYPCAFLVVMLGVKAVGPTTALLMFLVSTMLLVIPREALMPFLVNSFKVLDARKVRVGKAAIWCGAAVLLALAVAVPVTLMFQYGAGTHHWDAWGTGAVPRYSFDKTVQIKLRLKAWDALDEAESVRGFARFARAEPETRSVVWFVVGAALVLALATARLHWAWWPIHPVIVIVFWNYPGIMFWHSFLLGWFIKTVVVRYGGQRLYKRLTPLMLGLVAGDMLGMLVPSVIGGVHYVVTGEVAPAYIVMPD